MNSDLETRILDLLRESPARSLPLREVHRILTAELGPGAGSLEQFRDRLNARPGAFLVVERESPLGDLTGWPATARAEYEHALRAAGLEVEPVLTAFPIPSPGPDPLDEVDTALIDLWESAARCPALRAAIASALADTRTVRGPAVPRSTSAAASAQPDGQ